MRYHLCHIDQHYKKLTEKNCTVDGALGSESMIPWCLPYKCCAKDKIPLLLNANRKASLAFGNTRTNIKYSVDFFLQPVHIAVVSKDGQIHVFEYSLNG